MLRAAVILVAAVLISNSALAAGVEVLVVQSTSPAANSGGISRNASISLTFDRAVNPATFIAPNFHAFGRWSGPVESTITLSNANRTVTLVPIRPFIAGEPVSVVLGKNLAAADGSLLRTQGYAYNFMVGVTPTPRKFRDMDPDNPPFTDRDETNAQTRIYGGLAGDLDHDGWCDMTIVNEVSADLRVFMNRADGSGLFGDLITPYTPIPFESSANEPGDFNFDGEWDIATVSATTGQTAIALGNGDGTYDAPQLLAMGTSCHGLAALDVDGDGDIDIATAATSPGNVQVARNNGAGVFGSVTNFDSGNGEYGLTAADMNNDRIMDLVVGNLNAGQVRVHLGNGNGTFTALAAVNSGGSPWMIVCGDVNGDGNIDVSCANSFANNGGMLLGNGNGTLQPATTVPMGGGTIASDLPDLDGDGDADWVLSSFGGGEWRVYQNTGGGVFVFDILFQAPSNPACCLPADFDNDGDVDLALIDEIADVVVMMENYCGGDYDNDNDIDVPDIFEFLSGWFAGDDEADMNEGGGSDVPDIFLFLGYWFVGCA